MKLSKIKQESHWAIYKCGKAYIVHNRNLHFETGHTHVSNIKTANDIVLMCRLGKVPNNWHPRILVSLMRVADIDHARKIESLLAQKLHKGKQQYNNKNRRAV